MTSDFIIDVSEANFEYEVLIYSQKVPVVVDFWAEWCAPCKLLGPLLERLAQEAQGSFRLAKLNVDTDPKIALRFGVHNIPSIKAFRNGQIVNEFLGTQSEQRLREFIREIAPSQSDLILEKGLSLLTMQQVEQAQQAFQKVLEINPENATALLGLAKCFLFMGHGAEARATLLRVPASKEYHPAEILRGLTDVLGMLDNNAIADNDPLDAMFINALRLVKRGNIEAALDGLLDLLRENKHYRGGKAHQVVLALLELMGNENPMGRQYRSELASVLF